MIDLDALATELRDAGIAVTSHVDPPGCKTPNRKLVRAAVVPALWVSECSETTADYYGRFTDETWKALDIIRKHIEAAQS